MVSSTSVRLMLCCGVAAAALAQPSAGLAQTTDGAEAIPEIAEVVVTARRSAEAAQTVPVALTAFSEERLQDLRITTAQDLQGKVPSLVVNSGGQTSRNVESFTIRGQGATFQASPGVVSYFAEVPLPQSNVTGAQGGGAGMFYDLQNLQVLKGPQGTLFGRNTTGGAVLYEPRRPTNDFEGYVQGEVGDYDHRALEGAVNLPVVDDRLLVRLAGAYAKREGFTRDVVTGKDYDDRNRWSGRASIVFRPTENIENYLLAYYLRSNTHGTSVVPLALRPGSTMDRLYGASNLADFMAGQQARGPRQVALSADPVDRTTVWGVTDILSIRLNDDLTLRNIVSYARLKNLFRDDPDGTIFPYRDIVSPDGTLSTDLSNFTEELQLQGKAFDEALVYTVGAFTERSEPEGVQEQYAFTSRPIPPGAPSRSVGGETRESYALYAQATLGLGLFSPALDKVRVTAGYRYSWDEKSTFTDFPTGLRTYDLKSEAPNWTLGVDYRPTSRLMAYAKVSRGYKSGGANRTAVNPTRATFRPEFVTSYEIGAKTDFRIADMPVRANLDYYYSDYEDIQRTGSDSFGGFFGSATVNAGEATIQGLEAEVTIRPIRSLELSAAYSNTAAAYQRFDLPVVNASGVIVGSTDLKGVPFQYAPDDIFSLGLRHEFDLGEDRGEIVTNLNYSYTSRQYSSPTASPATEPFAYIPSTSLLNASIAWNGVLGGPVDLRLFATNLTDETYISSVRASYVSGYATAVYGEPRMVGLQLRYNLGGDR